MRTMRDRKHSTLETGGGSDEERLYGNISANKNKVSQVYTNGAFSPQKLLPNGRMSSEALREERTTMVSNQRSNQQLTHNFSGERIGTEIDHQMLGKDYKNTTGSFPDVKVTKKLNPNNTYS